MKPILHQAIYIELKRSYLMLGLLCAISFGCCCVLLALPIALTIKVIAITLVFFSSSYFILRDALRMLPWSWQLLVVDSKGQLTLSNQLGQQKQPTLAGSSFIHAKLVILNFKRDGINWPLPPVILLLNDSDEARRLRVWMRWAKQTQEDLFAAKV